MNVLFEEDGAFKVASLMSESESSMQVETASGKRSKIKTSHVLMRFEGSLTGFMESAEKEAETLETDFLWECCGEGDFSFANLAQEYYGAKPTPIQQAAIAIKLHRAPMYFYRKGKGQYKAAPEDILKAALAGMERKRLQAEQVEAMVETLRQQKLPEAFVPKLDTLLYAPDKNSLEWKALDQWCAEQKKSSIEVLFQVGAIPSVHDYHLGAFLREYFPEGDAFSADILDETYVDEISLEALPLSPVKAFSIDDATTTEIDDALSVTPLENGYTQVGIHIAAPALGVITHGALDKEVMRRLSTVYMPGHKITMLPEVAIRPYSLDAGMIKPVLSLYLEVGANYEVFSRKTVLDRVLIADNLRHDTLEPFFNEETLLHDSGHPYWSALSYLHGLAEAFEKGRGKYDPSKPQPLDYNFYVNEGKVTIVNRQRGSPMDKLVAEMMIEANCQWGALLNEHEVPGIYRAQNGGKVYMTTHAEPHQGLGVAQYAWSTSPLRRAVDLINQRQLIAVTQAQAVPYAADDDEIVEHMRQFDITYNAYNEFQTRMERFWCLQYLIQESITQITATVWRENLVRLEGLPYLTKVSGLPVLSSGTKVVIQITKVDTLMMTMESRFESVLQETLETISQEDSEEE